MFVHVRTFSKRAGAITLVRLFTDGSASKLAALSGSRYMPNVTGAGKCIWGSAVVLWRISAQF
jgi:hypothetical protein